MGRNSHGQVSRSKGVSENTTVYTFACRNKLALMQHFCFSGGDFSRCRLPDNSNRVVVVESIITKKRNLLLRSLRIEKLTANTATSPAIDIF